ncbi:hypothetical protein NZD89_28595 (plasmid) [Alicyclobacillus fastidiosus]|uniref:Uncharacterized protein n=1 Tax=Alicyclobacillus fastidiosus TaxID=392011 RepID=A0ABY6ZPP2_9BACL|nr:hypothetical protein [Alicyclobacillus fastidiosus]WAH44817.1 hypothetical protein NZD89_28595 [Alicyclobacillus fastidiosus]GMA65780.1 hypothetical protein GCM10025859_62200 [Alicyclobacillus fastidiosus]
MTDSLVDVAHVYLLGGEITLKRFLAQALMAGGIVVGLATYFGPTAMAGTKLGNPLGHAQIHTGTFTNSDVDTWNSQIMKYWYELTPGQRDSVIKNDTTGINAAPFGVDTAKELYDTKTGTWVTNPGYDMPRGYSYCPDKWDGMINPTCKTPQAVCHLSITPSGSDDNRVGNNNQWKDERWG